MNKAGDVGRFNEALQTVKAERRKAENVLLDEVEADVLQKEKFLSE